MRKRLVTAAVATIVIGSFVLASWRIWVSIRASGYDACLASLVDQIWKRDLTREIARNSPDWTVLSSEEFDRVMVGVKGTDCGGFYDPKLDFFGSRLNIAVRQERKDRWPPIVVWSNGADRKSGTEDDIVMPFGQAVPK